MESKTFVHSTAEVSKDAKIGEGTKIWHHAQVREGVIIGKNCILGKCAYVDKNVKVGNEVKIQNMATLYDGVVVGDRVFIGPHVTFTNDMFPRSFNKDWKIVPTFVKNGASIGANSTIVCGVTINEYAMVGAGSLVTKDVPSHGLVYGNPARLRGFVCVCGDKLAKSKKKEGNVVMKCDVCKNESSVPEKIFDSVK